MLKNRAYFYRQKNFIKAFLGPYAYCFAVSLCLSFAVLLWVSGCTETSASQTENASRILPKIAAPAARSESFLTAFKKELVVSLRDHSSTAIGGVKASSLRPRLTATLVSVLLKSGGVPRHQIRDVLSKLVAPESTFCGGVSCSRILGITPQTLDGYLDEVLSNVGKNRLLRDAEHAKEYSILIGSLTRQEQTAWNRPTVDGISYLPNGEIDRTEGVGAFMDLPLQQGTRNLDVGGGAHDANTKYLASRGILNFVYDPYARSVEHNSLVMRTTAEEPVDTVTSMSILNVIDNVDARRSHLELCKKSLKNRGKAYFKVWAGSGSGKSEYLQGGYQSNRQAGTYLDEVREVFGDRAVSYDARLDVIIAVKS
jgi:hypothetical protein